ncbi:hypothetical protein G6011_01164 [Alternaria panax]|uniref:Uncharacterized protein n=1 Tax=Alternaria panax TaxID=48097 RepID=A0AAD4NVK9_9PLEO|nr:hypothetical protein G6011_01164 [Alternaria panax]
MDFTINTNNLHADSLREFDEYPLASDSHAQRVLYFFFRGLEEMAIAQYDRMTVYMVFGDSMFPEEQAELDVLVVEWNVLVKAVDWAGKAYGGDACRADEHEDEELMDTSA